MLFVTKVCVENDISIVIKLKHDNPINVTVTFAGNFFKVIFLKELIKNNFSQTLKSFLKHVMLNEIIFFSLESQIIAKYCTFLEQTKILKI